jgi:hypothetical protein
MKEMVTGVGKELSWQHHSLCRFGHWRAPDTSSTILVPGYKFNLFRAIGNKMEILYPDISITKEVYCIFNILKNLVAKSSNRIMGAEENGECLNSMSNRMKKMATGVGKELC